MRGMRPTLLAVALMACSPLDQAQTAEIPPQAPPQQPGCNAQASRDWSAVGSQYYVIEAEAHGETCATAVATIRIESRDGTVLFTRDYPVADVPAAFSAGSDQTGLRVEIEGWTMNAADTATADWLPAWPARAERPPHFQPAVTRNRYEAARGAQGPLFCYPDGAQSSACVAMAGDGATFLGSLTPERE
jgi:hypothetical protein